MRSQQSRERQSKRWRAAAPLDLSPNETLVGQFTICSFTFLVSNRSLFFMHAQEEGAHNASKPSVHQVKLREGIV